MHFPAEQAENLGCVFVHPTAPVFLFRADSVFGRCNFNRRNRRVAEQVKRETIRIVPHQPQNATGVSLESLPQRPIIIDARCIPSVTINGAQILRRVFVFAVMFLPIIAQEFRRTLDGEFGIARIIPNLPQMQESVEFPVSVAK
jgi:hypothetical protein